MNQEVTRCPPVMNAPPRWPTRPGSWPPAAGACWPAAPTSIRPTSGGPRRPVARHLGDRRSAGHPAEPGRLVDRRRDDLDRPAARRPAAAVRRAERGGARDRRHADPERRDRRRQFLQRIAGRRRHAAADRARRPGRAAARARRAAHGARPISSPARGARPCRRRAGLRDAVAGAPPGALGVRQARRPPLPAISISMVAAVVEPVAGRRVRTRRIAVGAARRARSAGRRSSGGSWPAGRPRSGRTASMPTTSRRLTPIDDVRASARTGSTPPRSCAPRARRGLRREPVAAGAAG